jgi:hypothetical protein
MQSEEAYVVEITKLMEYVEGREHRLIQTVRTHQHSINSEMLQTARRIKRELKTGTIQIKDRVAENTKERWRSKKGCIDSSHVT